MCGEGGNGLQSRKEGGSRYARRPVAGILPFMTDHSLNIADLWFLRAIQSPTWARECTLVGDGIRVKLKAGLVPWKSHALANHLDINKISILTCGEFVT